MFGKLRNKLILINLGITSAIILLVFTAIYIISTRSADQRPPISENMPRYEMEMEEIIENMIKDEKAAAARDLLIVLIVSGVTIEILVTLVSYYLAEEAIKPVREAYEAQKVFIANASHEIKTPLAAISANLEAADIKGNKWIDNVEKEAEKLAELNGQLLNLARTDLVTDTVVREVSLAKVVEKCLDGMEPRMTKINFMKHIDAIGKIKTNEEDFTQIVGILMDNAIKYCDKCIELSLSRHELTIKNDGRYIDTKALPHIFERFYQADKSTEGVGLGLAIAKNLADRNGWDIVVKSEKGMTEFVVKF